MFPKHSVTGIPMHYAGNSTYIVIAKHCSITWLMDSLGNVLGDLGPHWMRFVLEWDNRSQRHCVCIHMPYIVCLHRSIHIVNIHPGVPECTSSCRYIPTHPTLPQFIPIRCHIQLELETLISQIKQYAQYNARTQQKRQ